MHVNQDEGACDDSQIGLLGGMGPMATQAFFGELIRQTAAASDQDHLHVVIDSDPSVPDRTAFLLGRGPSPYPTLLPATNRLAAAGAEFIVMPCNTAQVFVPELERATGVPFVPWVEAAADAVAALGRLPVAILATAGTQEVDVYGPPLRERGLAYLVPDPQEVEEVMACIYEVKATNRATRASQARLLRVAGALRDRGADSFLLACTELPLVLSP